jgi:hypothetical protein
MGKPFLGYAGGLLRMEEVPLAELAERFGSARLAFLPDQLVPVERKKTPAATGKAPALRFRGLGSLGSAHGDGFRRIELQCRAAGNEFLSPFQQFAPPGGQFPRLVED